jgi:hypothetical protein
MPSRRIALATARLAGERGQAFIGWHLLPICCELQMASSMARSLAPITQVNRMGLSYVCYGTNQGLTPLDFANLYRLT